MREMFDLIPEAAEWEDKALCAQTDPEAFFPDRGGSPRAAKRVCQQCEVRTECLTAALVRDERHGVWGGLTETERRRFQQAAAESGAA